MSSIVFVATLTLSDLHSFCFPIVVSMSVQKLKVMVQRLYKADPQTLRLTYTSEKVS